MNNLEKLANLALHVPREMPTEQARRNRSKRAKLFSLLRTGDLIKDPKELS